MDKVNEALRKTRFMKRIKDDNLDKLVTTVLGPSNHFVNDFSDPSYDIGARYGGCRMLITIYNEFASEEDNDDLFKGYCDYCLKAVPTIWNAVRMPMSLGGWRYWYCSWKCTRKWAKKYERDYDIILSLIKSYATQTPKVQVRHEATE